MKDYKNGARFLGQRLTKMTCFRLNNRRTKGNKAHNKKSSANITIGSYFAPPANCYREPKIENCIKYVFYLPIILIGFNYVY